MKCYYCDADTTKAKIANALYCARCDTIMDMPERTDAQRIWLDGSEQERAYMLRAISECEDRTPVELSDALHELFLASVKLVSADEIKADEELDT